MTKKSKSHKSKQSKKSKHKHKAHRRIRGSRKKSANVGLKFRLKGKIQPPPKDGPSPSQFTPNDMTTIYKVPNYCFKDETEVIAYNGYEIGSGIGEGGFSTIFKAKSIKSGKLAALKVVEIGNDASKIESMKNEIFIMELLDNMYTIKLYTHFIINDNLYIIMQLADSGCFAKLLEKEGPLDEATSAKYFGQMVVGIEHVHNMKIAHRDIKPANFLMTKIKNEKIVLVADYGLSRVCKKDDKGNVELYSTRCGTPAFMAPEVLGESDYNPYLYDVWSLAITLYVMLNMQGPFNCDADDMGLSEMINSQWKFSDKMKAPPSNALSDIMSKMLEPNFENRISLKNVSSHEWLKNDYHKAKKLEKGHKKF